MVLLVAAAAAVWATSRSDDDSTTKGDALVAVPTDGANGGGSCEHSHHGHNVMMWDPTMADEMLDLGCPWPYPPFETPTDGGQEDPALGSPFEAHRYAEIWDAFGQTDLGVCQVAKLPDEPDDGFAFGFDYTAGEPGCPPGSDTASLVVREYATRAQRDAAAHEAASGGTDSDAPDSVQVLGRWTLTTAADDDAQSRAITDALTEAGAVEVEA